jgi:dTDP-4-amino-4,6-dideoxygalactose transaminase
MTVHQIRLETAALLPPPAISFVDLASQHTEIEAEVTAGMARVMSDTSFVGGPDVEGFEQMWAAYCQASWAVGVASGTDAIELALRAVGVAAGDEVIVPANSFIASAGAVARAGAVPVFVDCDPKHLLIDPERIAAAVTPRTRAIMPVHLYGQLAPMGRIAEIGDRFGIPIVEDGAQAHGATQHGRPMGSWGQAAATSFYPGKNLGAYGDGGAVTTDSQEIANALRGLRNHGSTTRYQHPTLGFNSRLDTLQAVVLTSKLRRLDEWNRARANAAERYGRLLDGVAGVQIPSAAKGNVHVWHLFVVRVAERDRCLSELNARGVPAAIHYPTPIHLTGAFSGLGYGPGDFPVAEEAAGEILSLPMHPHLTRWQQEYVAETLAEIVGRA